MNNHQTISEAKVMLTADIYKKHQYYMNDEWQESKVHEIGNDS